MPSNPPTLKELNEIVSNYLQNDVSSTNELYKQLADILFGQHTEQPKEEFKVDEKRMAQYNNNHLFCRFYHLFEYEATYYSYLIAKLSARSLFNSSEFENGLLSRRDRDLIFVKPGETLNYPREILRCQNIC